MHQYRTAPRVCLCCEETFFIDRSRPHDSAGKFCCRECYVRHRRSEAERAFWSRLEKQENGCWFFTGYTTDGYGRYRIGRRTWLAHRWAYSLAIGTIPDGLFVCHRCDANYPPGNIAYRRCCNPGHLFLGTRQDNSDDMKRKGRAATGDRHWVRRFPQRWAEISQPHRGEDNARAKLSEADVRLIRNIYAAGGITFRALSRQFGVHETNIAHIVYRKSWQHIE